MQITSPNLFFIEIFRFINLMTQVVLGQNVINPVEVVHLMSFLQTFQGPKGTSNQSGDLFCAKKHFILHILLSRDWCFLKYLTDILNNEPNCLMILLFFYYFIVYSDNNLKSQVFKLKILTCKFSKEYHHISRMEWRETQLIGFKGSFLSGFLNFF